MFYKILQLMLKIPVLQYIRILFFLFDGVVLNFIKKPSINNKKSMLIVFPLALGDAVMMIGALESLTEIYSGQGYEITLLCQTAYKNLFKKYVEKVIPVDLRGASVSPKKRIDFLKKCREEYYDIIIDPTGSEECTPGVFAVNAAVGRKKIGVLSARKKKIQLPSFIRNKVYNQVIYKKEVGIHRVRYYAEVFAEISNRRISPCLANLPIGRELELPDNYIVVFPSASTPIKRWPVERFASITKKIITIMPTTVVVCGTKSDREITEEFIKLLGDDATVINYIDRTNVISLIELIARSSLVFTNDTSIYHIAVATRRKTCCVTGDYVHSMFIDYETENIIKDNNVRAVMPNWECANCENNCKKVEGDTYPCVLANSEEKVWDAIKSLVEVDL